MSARRVTTTGGTTASVEGLDLYLTNPDAPAGLERLHVGHLEGDGVVWGVRRDYRLTPAVLRAVAAVVESHASKAEP